MMRLPPFLALASLVAACAGREPSPADHEGLEIVTALATVSPASGVSAVYLTIRNRGGAPDTLLALDADEGRAELHTVVTQGGRSTMQRVERLAIAAGEEVRFQPGGYHVMLTRPDPPLAVGDTVELRAMFARADTVVLRAPVLTYTDAVERLESDGVRTP